MNNKMKSSLKKNMNIKNRDFIFQNLDKYSPTIFVHFYVDDEMFTEEFILNNIEYFDEIIEMIIKRKKILSDSFFKAVCTKLNYSRLKTTRQLFEPFRDFKQLDDLFY